MFLFPSCICLGRIHWSYALSRKWGYFGVAPTGDTPTTSEWSTSLLPTKGVCYWHQLHEGIDVTPTTMVNRVYYTRPTHLVHSYQYSAYWKQIKVWIESICSPRCYVTTILGGEYHNRPLPHDSWRRVSQPPPPPRILEASITTAPSPTNLGGEYHNRPLPHDSWRRVSQPPPPPRILEASITTAPSPTNLGGEYHNRPLPHESWRRVSQPPPPPRFLEASITTAPSPTNLGGEYHNAITLIMTSLYVFSNIHSGIWTRFTRLEFIIMCINIYTCLWLWLLLHSKFLYQSC